MMTGGEGGMMAGGGGGWWQEGEGDGGRRGRGDGDISCPATCHTNPLRLHGTIGSLSYPILNIQSKDY